MARFSPEIARVGESRFGQCSVQLIMVWQEWHPASPASKCLGQLAMRLQQGVGPAESAGFFNRMGRWFKR